MRTIEEMNNYFEALYALKATYCWRYNGQVMTPQNIVDTYHAEYHSNPNSKYNSAYYEAKLKEGANRIACDCSGAFCQLHGSDTNAQGYYDGCNKKGNISDINPNVACMVFKGTPTNITHIGWNLGNGYTIEMESSATNCVKRLLSKGTWTLFGLPSWVDYSKQSSTTPSIPIVNPTPSTPATSTNNTTIVKGLDISSYNKISNYKALKDANVNFAVLKVIRKDLTPDKLFETHYKNCKAVGINCDDVYNYSYATTVEKAKVDAQKVIDTLNGRKMRVWLDVEDKCQQNIGKKLIDIINAYQSVINNANLDCGIYTGMSFYKSYIKPYEANLKCNKLWIARYYKGDTVMNLSDNPNETYNPSKNIGKNIWAWQYTSKLTIPTAYSGVLDCNIYYGNTVDGKVNVTPVVSTTPTDTKVKPLEQAQELLCIATGNVYSHTSPDADASTRSTLIKNEELVNAVAVTSNGYWKLSTGNYVNGKYCRQAIGVISNCNSVNVRSSADSTTKVTDKKNNIVGSLKAGDKIRIKKLENKFYSISTSDGMTGYVKEDFVTVQ